MRHYTIGIEPSLRLLCWDKRHAPYTYRIERFLFSALVGQEGIEPTRPCKRTGFTDRGAYLNALLTLVRIIGFEPMTFRLSVERSNQLSYTRIFLIMALPAGLEPATYWLTASRSANWAKEEYNGREGGNRTHSPIRNGFTVRRRSPTRPPPEI